MKLSSLLAPTLQKLENPTSVALLNAHGFVHKTQSGIYDILPLGLRVQRKIEAIVRNRMNGALSQELALSSLVDPSIWQKSGRLDRNGGGEFIFADKHLLAPTGEEQITTLVGNRSYRQLPLSLYQITRKYRNELRAKSGLLRTREFSMKDAYTFDIDRENALKAYENVSKAYRQIFEDIGISVVAAKADSGNMGGSLSHEYHLLSSLGEDQVLVCESCHSAKNIEVSSSTECEECGGELKEHKGIEVGHTFYLGTRYTEPLKANVTLKSGQLAPIEMGSYGLGITRLIGAIADALMDSRGLRWPKAVAPAMACVVSRDTDQAAEFAGLLNSKGIETVSEDRTTQIGHALRAAREAGWPYILVLGKEFKDGKVEVISREKTEFMSVDDVIATLR